MEGEDRTAKDPFAEPSQVLKSSDAPEVAGRASVPFEDGKFKISLMLWDMYISHPDLDFTAPKFLDTYVVKLLAVIYLANAQATPLSNQWVPYRELKDGLFYAKSFTDTVEERISRRFGTDIEGMKEACLALGGREVSQGDLGLVINTFPRLPLLFIIWRGDDEFEANARILFDASATNYLNAFELRMLCGEIVNRLIRMADGALELPPRD
ncbi:MAG: hypothetical protein A2Y75_08445 [Candidatus Solincola sediminis]|uniref:DUF3786 domain-containing protein n=1 Tax=Candidatus Solincola sediminis TaxID=1797199 RepID=A0A1F2WUF4_9ACTN|nr:MAG: hypothetical protein A2Y75_08445 [Candidatus Solincola sediminis]